MDDPKRDLVRAWLIKARNDLLAAQHLSALPSGPLDAAIYHCQQAAEKAVKGFLAFHDHPLERSHDVERLVELAQQYEPGFGSWIDTGAILTPYATAYRYPGESAALEPDPVELAEALKLATELVAYIVSLLPESL